VWANLRLLADLTPFSLQTPYVRRPRRPRRELGEALLEGDRPPGPRTQWTEPLNKYAIPRLIQDGDWRLSDGQATAEQLEQLELGDPLSPENYAARFQQLLWLEERQMQRDIRHFDIDSAVLQPSGHGGFLMLNVPGLAEKRPSVLRGDHLFARAMGGLWKGYVHRVHREEVILKFHRQLPANARLSADISFSFARTQLQIAHRAVRETDDWLNIRSHVLFPEPLDSIPGGDSVSANWNSGLEHADSIQPSRWFNRDLNEEQRVAVASMVETTDQPVKAPFVLFGPPGTGKTITVVEAIKQVATNVPTRMRRILVAAPSNSAADLLCARLNVLSTAQMIRVNAFQRDVQSVEAVVMRYCQACYVQNEGFELPDAARLSTHTVIVCTYATAGKLLGIGMRGGFSHVFLDEAGHAHEPEAVSAFAGLLEPRYGRLVMAGDPRQLGAIIRSNLASVAGLGESLLERMMTRYDQPRLMAAFSRLALMAAMQTDSGSPLQWLQIERERVASWVPTLPEYRSTFDRFRAEAFAWHTQSQDPSHIVSAPPLVEYDVFLPEMNFVPEPEPQLEPSDAEQLDNPSSEGNVALLRRHDWRVCVKLVQNYRSHPALLKLPSQLFYDDELRAAADPVLTNSLTQWDELPAQGFPMVSNAPVTARFVDRVLTLLCSCRYRFSTASKERTSRRATVRHGLTWTKWPRSASTSACSLTTERLASPRRISAW
jgi:hypothetical protein